MPVAHRLPAAAQVAVILLAAAALGVLAQTISPRRIPWREDWSRYVETKALAAGLPLASLDDAQRIVAGQTHLILDARSMADYDRGHLPGAMPLPHAQLETAYLDIAPLLTPEQPIMVYCSGLECDESFLLSLHLREQGFTNVSLFVGGYAAWQAAEATR